MEYGGLYEPDAGLLTVAGVLLIGWYAILVVLTLIRWPKSPDPGPATNDLRGEPPAIANLLTNGWLLTEDAMPATLLDLAARGLVAIEDRGDGELQCRIRSRQEAKDVQSYERKILDHLDRLANGRIVPVGALTTGPQDQSKRWWKSFQKEVGIDAKQRGVARELWPIRLSLMMLALGVPIFLIVQSAQGWNDSEDVHMTPLLTAVTIAMYGGLVPLGYLTVTARLRDTSAGRDAAQHWLGVHKNLATLPSFPDLPPDAVATWGRHLAYGAALGTAGRAVTMLPLGAEHDRRAWTDYGGTWRQVNVRYPRFRPSWGMHPGLALLVNVLRAAAFGGALWLAASLGVLRLSAYGDDLPWWGMGLLIVLPLAVGAALLWSLAGLFWAVMDLGSTVTIEGEVLRTRVRGKRGPRYGDSEKTFHVAVYSGTGDSIVAWRVNAEKYSRFYQGQEVRVEVTPRLGYVRG